MTYWSSFDLTAPVNDNSFAGLKFNVPGNNGTNFYSVIWEQWCILLYPGQATQPTRTQTCPSSYGHPFEMSYASLFKCNTSTNCMQHHPTWHKRFLLSSSLEQCLIPN